MGLTIKDSISGVFTKVRISALDHSILVADSFISVKDNLTIKVIDNTVTTMVETVSANPNHDESAWVTVITDVGFSLKS